MLWRWFQAYRAQRRASELRPNPARLRPAPPFVFNAYDPTDTRLREALDGRETADEAITCLHHQNNRLRAERDHLRAELHRLQKFRTFRP